MERLAGVVVEAIVLHYGRAELLRRLAHPFWFQAFGALMGQDWHSSGITTSTVWALKRALADRQWELGVHVCGGRGSHSRNTPQELRGIGERTGVDGERLGEISRLVAKVDSAAVQDGFAIYLHTFVVSDDGAWTVIQQGMNAATRLARRYHWLSEGLSSFVEAPHSAIDGQPVGNIVNLTDRRAARAREIDAELARGDPDRVLLELRKLLQTRQANLFANEAHLRMPAHHDVWPTDVSLKRLRGNLAAAANRGPRDFTELLLTPGVGARTVFALSLAAELIHGAPSRFADPARFSFAQGGKDGHPFPVPIKVYDETLRVLRSAVARARLGNDDKLAALRALDRESRRLEGAQGPSLKELVANERLMSPALDGRTAGTSSSTSLDDRPAATDASTSLDGRTAGTGSFNSLDDRTAARGASTSLDGRTAGTGSSTSLDDRTAATDASTSLDGRTAATGSSPHSLPQLATAAATR